MPQRLGCGCAAWAPCPCCCGAACCAGLAGVDAGGAVTLRCAPTERPPPRRFASASVATIAPATSAMQSPINHLPIVCTLLEVMLSKAHAAMDGHDSRGEIEYFDLRKPRLFHH